jgi:hypothetical protein
MFWSPFKDLFHQSKTACFSFIKLSVGFGFKTVNSLSQHKIALMIKLLLLSPIVKAHKPSITDENPFITGYANDEGSAGTISLININKLPPGTPYTLWNFIIKKFINDTSGNPYKLYLTDPLIASGELNATTCSWDSLGRAEELLEYVSVIASKPDMAANWVLEMANTYGICTKTPEKATGYSEILALSIVMGLLLYCVNYYAKRKIHQRLQAIEDSRSNDEDANPHNIP